MVVGLLMENFPNCLQVVKSPQTGKTRQNCIMIRAGKRTFKKDFQFKRSGNLHERIQSLIDPDRLVSLIDLTRKIGVIVVAGVIFQIREPSYFQVRAPVTLTLDSLSTFTQPQSTKPTKLAALSLINLSSTSPERFLHPY